MEEIRLISRGSKAYNRVNFALFLAGFITFSTLYDFQPLFPSLVNEFAVTPAVASLSLSFATFALAWTLPVSGSLSDAIGRRNIMGVALFLSALLTLAIVAADSLPLLLAFRLLQGLVLAGVPAVAMAYLSEEIDPRTIGNAMGLYIAGNAFGGMTGRILTALLNDYLSWRWAIGVIGILCLTLAIVFSALLPPSRHFKQRPLHLGQLTGTLLNHLQNSRLLCLFLIAFTCMGGFVTLYNYVTFRLIGVEFGLSQAEAAAIFLAYAFGGFGSRFIGGISSRFGRNPTLLACLATMMTGLGFTLSGSLPLVIAGIVIFTIGFFGAHAVASAWVGFLATHSRAQASSLYLFSYYLGSSLSGTGGGFIYSLWGWPGVVLFILLLIALAALAVLRLVSLVGEQVPSHDIERIAEADAVECSRQGVNLACQMKVSQKSFPRDAR